MGSVGNYCNPFINWFYDEEMQSVLINHSFRKSETMTTTQYVDQNHTCGYLMVSCDLVRLSYLISHSMWGVLNFLACFECISSISNTTASLIRDRNPRIALKFNLRKKHRDWANLLYWVNRFTFAIKLTNWTNLSHFIDLTEANSCKSQQTVPLPIV